MVQIFNELIDWIANGLVDHNKIRVIIRHPGLDRPINLPTMMLADLDAERIISEIEMVLQSNEAF